MGILLKVLTYEKASAFAGNFFNTTEIQRTQRKSSQRSLCALWTSLVDGGFPLSGGKKIEQETMRW